MKNYAWIFFNCTSNTSEEFTCSEQTVGRKKALKIRPRLWRGSVAESRSIRFFERVEATRTIGLALLSRLKWRCAPYVSLRRWTWTDDRERVPSKSWIAKNAVQNSIDEKLIVKRWSSRNLATDICLRDQVSAVGLIIDLPSVPDNLPWGVWLPHAGSNEFDVQDNRLMNLILDQAYGENKKLQGWMLLSPM